MKRRSSAIGLNERCTSPVIKRTKVHAQRKFAQGSNNYITTPTKLPKPNDPSTQPFSPETNSVADNDDPVLNNFSNLPTIDDFLTFLCYRETDVLPQRLNYLNTPQFENIPAKKKPLKSNSTSSSSLPSSKSSIDHDKASEKVNSNFKSNKKVPEFPLRTKEIKCKPIISKASRSLALKHNQRLRKTVQTKFTDSKLPNFKVKNTLNKFTSPKNNVNEKVNNVKNHSITRTTGVAKVTPKNVEPETKRVTRRNSNLNDLEVVKSPAKRSQTKSNSSPVTKELPASVDTTPKKVSGRSLRVSVAKLPSSFTTSISPLKRSTRLATARLESNLKTPSTSSRPTRKTKEAATLYMETLGKDLLRGEDSFDEDDLSLESYFELPSIEPEKPKKEIKEPPKKPKPVNTVKKSTPKLIKKQANKKAPLKIGDKSHKPARKIIKKDRAQIKKLNDELKKIVEDEPLKEKLEHITKSIDVDRELETIDQTLNNTKVEELNNITKLSNEFIETNKKSGDHGLLLFNKETEKIDISKDYDGIENIDIPEFMMDDTSDELENLANHILQDENISEQIITNDVLKKDTVTVKNIENIVLPEKDIVDETTENSVQQKVVKTMMNSSKKNCLKKSTGKSRKLEPSIPIKKSKLSIKAKDVVEKTKSEVSKIPVKNNHSIEKPAEKIEKIEIFNSIAKNCSKKPTKIEKPGVSNLDSKNFLKKSAEKLEKVEVIFKKSMEKVEKPEAPSKKIAEKVEKSEIPLKKSKEKTNAGTKKSTNKVEKAEVPLKKSAEKNEKSEVVLKKPAEKVEKSNVHMKNSTEKSEVVSKKSTEKVEKSEAESEKSSEKIEKFECVSKKSTEKVEKSQATFKKTIDKIEKSEVVKKSSEKVEKSESFSKKFTEEKYKLVTASKKSIEKIEKPEISLKKANNKIEKSEVVKKSSEKVENSESVLKKFTEEMDKPATASKKSIEKIEKPEISLKKSNEKEKSEIASKKSTEEIEKPEISLKKVNNKIEKSEVMKKSSEKVEKPESVLKKFAEEMDKLTAVSKKSIEEMEKPEIALKKPNEKEKSETASKKSIEKMEKPEISLKKPNEKVEKLETASKKLTDKIEKSEVPLKKSTDKSEKLPVVNSSTKNCSKKPAEKLNKTEIPSKKPSIKVDKAKNSSSSAKADMKKPVEKIEPSVTISTDNMLIDLDEDEPTEVEENLPHKIPSKLKPIVDPKPNSNSTVEKCKADEKKTVEEPVCKSPTIKKNLNLKKSSVKIIRAKSKLDEEEAAKQVKTSDITNIIEAATESNTNQEMLNDKVEDVTKLMPKLVFANGKTTTTEDLENPIIQTIASSSNKMFCLESKKIIFKKNKAPIVADEKEESSPRKTEAFSADNENSVYAFEPDLPTTSPPFRRLKPVTPTKSLISGSSIAVQVNFESNAKIECSSSSETQVSSTTDCDDRVFYIPIQTSDTSSTLGVAVKLDTDGANQKIIMSATLVTKSPSFTTSTCTTVASKSVNPIPSTPEEPAELPNKPQPKETLDKVVATADSQSSPQTPTDSPSSTVVSPKSNKKVSSTTKPNQSVKIVKINKVKKPLPPPKVKPKPVRAKSNKTKPIPSTSSSEILEAPTFYPSEAEFNDPLKYIDTIRSVAEKFGVCRIVPPSTFRPECKVADEMRFTAFNQYVHKMLHRWGPNVKEVMAIKKFLTTQNIQLTQIPVIGGMEVDLPRLYQMVQQCGGLKAVIEKERWHQVADVMKIPKLAQDRITKLDDIYCKYLLPYDILSHGEREKLFDEVEKDWNAHLKNPNDDDEIFDDVDECIVKGRTMPLSCFYRIARNTMMMCFGSVEGQKGPSTETIEAEFWNHVSQRKSHICVNSGSIDTGVHGYGFSVAKNSTFRKHPWNLKVLTNNSASILRSLGPIMGVTVPTLHVGMLYSACCWYRDPHGLPWIEYLHTGANKIWYGIPDEYSDQFNKAMRTLVPRYCRDKRLWLPSDTVMIPPPLLATHNVPLSRVVQQPGQFIVVFPKAFTSCISTGYMVSESVYFAHTSWLNSAKQIFADMQESCEPSVFSLEQLLINVATDIRASLLILSKVLPLLIELRDTEITLRNQLVKLGLSASQKMKIDKKRKSKASFNDEDNYECEICRANLFVSLVINSHDEMNYCLKHAVSFLQKKPAQVKHCKLMCAYTEDELEEIIKKVQVKIETKSNRKPNTKQNSN